MNIYELITPSDAITFQTEDDKIAYTCTILLGEGKAGCKRFDEKGEEVDLPTMLMFDNNPDKTIEKYLGSDLGNFIGNNTGKIKECFESFAYGDIESRKSYNDSIDAITDPEKLKEFKKKHEDRNRSSMSAWVKGAWNYAENLK